MLEMKSLKKIATGESQGAVCPTQGKAHSMQFDAIGGPVEQKKRRMEHGKISIVKHSNVEIVFELIPFWLLAFIPAAIKVFYIPQCESFSQLRQRLSPKPEIARYYDSLVSRFGRQCFQFGQHQDKVDLVLISGSVEFLNDKHNNLRRKIG